MCKIFRSGHLKRSLTCLRINILYPRKENHLAYSSSLICSFSTTLHVLRKAAPEDPRGSWRGGQPLGLLHLQGNLSPINNDSWKHVVVMWFVHTYCEENWAEEFIGPTSDLVHNVLWFERTRRSLKPQNILTIGAVGYPISFGVKKIYTALLFPAVMFLVLICTGKYWMLLVKGWNVIKWELNIKPFSSDCLVFFLNLIKQTATTSNKQTNISSLHTKFTSKSVNTFK